MTVKAVILDLDGTLLDSDGTPQVGVPEMVEQLRDAGIKIAVASNRSGAHGKLDSAGIYADLIVDRKLVGLPKGSPLWVDRPRKILGVAPNELLCLGDSEYDMISASHARVIYFNAGWSNPDFDYGITINKPQLFSLVVLECFSKPLDWYFDLSTTDQLGRLVTARALIDGNGAGNTSLKQRLLGFFRYGSGSSVGPLDFRWFIMLHLLGSIYGEGLYREADIWTFYPGSKGNIPAALNPVLRTTAKLFRDRYVPDLLTRHTDAIDSGETRAAGGEVDFANQINTVQLNEEHSERIQDQEVLVIDDFEDKGYSMECARNLLLEAGAAKVVGVSVGKYGYQRYVAAPGALYRWNPYDPIEHADGTFEERSVRGTYNNDALEVLRASFLRVRAL